MGFERSMGLFVHTSTLLRFDSNNAIRRPGYVCSCIDTVKCEVMREDDGLGGGSGRRRLRSTTVTTLAGVASMHAGGSCDHRC
jgi:hypothetical protein